MSEVAVPQGLRRNDRLAWNKCTGLGTVLKRWRSDSKFYHNIVFDAVVPPHGQKVQSFPEALANCVRTALEQRGIRQLYSHQVEAFGLASAGTNVVVATPTASGKSFCYNLPIVNDMARESHIRALYLFPTKALCRDQEQNLRKLMNDVGLSHGAMTYDGDTPADVRRAARDHGGVLLTNPDMLHAGIMPHHAVWARLFANLKYIVIDELHTYRGVFGSHLANVLRRLKRIAAFHGANPTFIFASATIGNPEEHAQRMIGSSVRLVECSGAPTGEKNVFIYNPPIVNAELGIRQSCIKTAVRLTAELAVANVSTLVFGQSRNNVEVMLKYLRDRLSREGMPRESIQGYRGGYLPEKRRAIESGLRDGNVRVVVATNALELGIDIGALQAVVCAGYPGSVAALWQRFGRAGRRGEASASILVTNSSPLNQFFALQPESLITGNVEHARIDPDNVEVLVQHLKCSAFELPFEPGECFGDLPYDAICDALEFLEEKRVLHGVETPFGKKVYHWSADSYPANHISLRSVGWDNFVVIDLVSNKSIAEMDWRSAHTMLHEQAIYQHSGEQYQVERLDYENHKAYVRMVNSDYYTDAITKIDVSVIDTDEQEKTDLGGKFSFWGGLGDVSIVEKAVGYKKIKYNTHENVGYGEVRLPQIQKHTTAFWITIPNALVNAQCVARADVMDAVRGMSVAIQTVAIVGLMIDPRDLGRVIGEQSDPQDPPLKSNGGRKNLFDPTIFLYDSIPGGVGLSSRLYDDRHALLRGTRSLVERCSCTQGCPACIGPIVEGDAMNKRASESASSTSARNDGRKKLVVKILNDLGVHVFS